MYECPNCGGNLKFEIPSQKLFCAYCDTRLEPEAVTKETDTLENDCFEVNVFLCPQCGGEMISGDNDATAFCSYCGAANILSSRISREKRPKYIIPFKKTKEDCKNAYKRRLRRAIFAPKELKDPKFIDSFRGIYMPYCLYHFTQKGPISFKGKKIRQKGNYRYTDHYALTADLDSENLGLSHDVSAAFYDNISQSLAPYNTQDLRAFTPSYLSGFYADIPDLDLSAYLWEATDLVNDNCVRMIQHHPAVKQFNPITFATQKSAALHTNCEHMDSAMYPVWFLSWRNKDRVAYAAVNGQTGKVAMEVPADPRKYIIASILLAIPIFLFLNLFLTLRPSLLLMVCTVLTLLAAEIYRYEVDAIFNQETHAFDKGMNIKSKNPQWLKTRLSNGAEEGNLSSLLTRLFSFSIIFLVGGAFLFSFSSRLFGLPLACCIIYICINGRKRLHKSKDSKGGFGLIATLVSVPAGTLVGLVQPVSDLWYYGCALMALVSVLICITDIILNYNRLATYKLPQFEKKGGEDRA